MPRSDAIPLGQSSTSTTPQPQDAPTGRAAAQPLNQPTTPAAPIASASASTASSSSDDLGTTAFWNKPANVTPWDYILAHLAKPFQGADQAAQDYSRTAVDAATFGLGDRFQSYLTGNPLDKERAATATASGRLGAMAPIVSGAMYAMGPGEIGAASKIGEAAAPWLGGGKVAQWTGGVLGSGVEGALAGGAGAAGHDESIGQGALIGGALGAASGVPGGVVGRGGALAQATSAADLHAAATKAYDPLSNVLYDATKEVHPTLDVTNAQNALRDWSASMRGRCLKDLKRSSDPTRQAAAFGQRYSAIAKLPERDRQRRPQRSQRCDVRQALCRQVAGRS